MTPSWFVRGDIDGFFGLALDNLIQVLLIVTLCQYVLGFGPDLLYGRVLPATAVSLLAGNAWYSWQAMKLARAEGRSDVCALPYGINTPSVFAYVFLVMLPVKLATGDPVAAWHAGLIACLGSGLIEFAGSFGADWLRRNVPRAALLSTLAGIALAFISMSFFFKTFAAPLVGLVTFAVVCLVYFGGVRFRGGIPGGLVAVAIGTALAWASGLAPVGNTPQEVGLYLPIPVLGDLWSALTGGYAMTYISIILPMGLFNVIGSLQNLDSAEAAGDRYATRPSLMANGAGTCIAALFGSCFPTTIYIGHPGWKGLGARIGYSWLNGVFMTVACITGTLGWIAWAVPIEAGMAIVIWIGIVITAQAFQASPQKHAPAVVIGLLPGVAAWGAIMVKQGVRAAGGTFGEELGANLTQNADVAANGLFALEQGFIFTAMILAAAAVAIIDKEYQKAGLWMVVGAALSATGLMHGWAWSSTDTILNLGWMAAPGATMGYAASAVVLFVAPYVIEKGPGAHA